jgi:hypothetical protein
MSSLPDEVSVLLQQSFLADVDTAPLDVLTVKRDACRRAAAALSFVARLYRADLEVIEAEAEWRSYSLDRQLSMLADTLAATVAEDAERPVLGQRELQAALPEGDGPLFGLDLLTGAQAVAEEVSAVAAALRRLSDAELAERSELVRSAAAAVQSRRAALRQTVDRLDAEIALRYRAGEADVAGQEGSDKDGDDGGR